MSLSEGYQLVQRIGSGVAGALYLAESGAGQVAIRQFEAQTEPDKELWQRNRQAFLDAGRQALGLKHPRIVQVLDVIDEGGEAFVVSEFVSAETLEKALASRRFTPEETGALLREMALALDFAHSRGIVHGDLKPSGVFLPGTQAKVADFAISPRARVDRWQPIPPHFFHRYLSPEHLHKPQSIGARSDQYSLAVIAYEMYTGQSPYGNPSNLQAAILTAEIPPPSRVNPALPPTLDEPIMRALDRDPARRFASCMEFMAVLGAGWITQLDAQSGPSRAKIFGGIAAALVLALGLTYYYHRKPVRPAVSPASQSSVVEPASVPVAADSKKPSPLTDLKSARPMRKNPAREDPPPGAVPAGKAVAYGGSRTPSLPFVEPLAADFDIAVFSREHPIQEGSSFAYGDQVLGELAHGDILASVSFNGPQQPRGRLTLEWVVDGVVMSSRAPVTLGRKTEYGNEPTAGTYVVTLYDDARVLKRFTFRITP
jgi:serine/threonine-protein kinase